MGNFSLAACSATSTSARALSTRSTYARALDEADFRAASARRAIGARLSSATSRLAAGSQSGEIQPSGTPLATRIAP